MIGGLITKRDEIIEEQIPLLGDLPLLGWLFKSRTVDRRRTELIIVLTPHILRSVEEADAATQKEWDRFERTRSLSQDEVKKAITLLCNCF